jgi:hypothetical protein
MLLNEVLPLLVQYWPLVLASVVTGWLLNNKFQKGLNKYPGPRLAGYTNWWRFWNVWGRKHQWTAIKLHREHGDVVRMGPNVLSFADPRSIKIIYGLNKGMTKVSPVDPLPKAWSDPAIVRLLSRPERRLQGSSPAVALFNHR